VTPTAVRDEALIDKALRRQLTFNGDLFLATLGGEIQSSIQDGFLRSLPAQYE
jgi:hypothetical protein